MSMLGTSAREIRRRLFNPPGGIVSSEIEIVANHHWQKRVAEHQNKLRKMERQARARRANELLEEYRRMLADWVASPTDSDPVFPGIPNVSISDILRMTCAHFGVRRDDLLSERREHSIVRPRHIVMYLARNLTPLSLPQIGYYLGGRDHTTVMSALAKLDHLILMNDEELIQDIAEIENALGVK